MTSKELFKKIVEEDVVVFTKEDFNIILKDLEELKELKELMGTPVQDIMKKLKEFEKVKSFVINRTVFYDNGCCLDEYIYYDSEIGTIFKKWNEE